jgi:hypothetical protein
LEQWAALGIVCGAILAAAGVAMLVTKGIGMVWRVIGERKEALELLADVKKSQSELTKRVDELSTRLDDYLRWYPHPDGKSATDRRRRATPAE